jgi:hypothetical protein
VVDIRFQNNRAFFLRDYCLFPIKLTLYSSFTKHRGYADASTDGDASVPTLLHTSLAPTRPGILAPRFQARIQSYGIIVMYLKTSTVMIWIKSDEYNGEGMWSDVDASPMIFKRLSKKKNPIPFHRNEVNVDEKNCTCHRP